ncbi:chymotrypsin-1-like [Schistocerca gregaria]|uniref:chymotrypsin-1-like n=1 Tax=Schistocerca gregaria TaxID=7010 RepID=UPI00211DFC45|nr:chymotrypsin-1-like [Schistocerca gregaria]
MRNLLVVYCLFGATALVSGHESRIVNGKPAADHEFPALSSLHVNGSHYCGANVLNERWLVTAAHCVIASGWSQQTILAGTNSQPSGGSVHQVERVIIHENYTGMPVFFADIALIRGDSVGPLYVDGQLVCTVDFSQHCGGITPPSVFTRVASFVSGYITTSNCQLLVPPAVEVSGHGGLIVNGEPAADEEFPAMASLHMNGSHYCRANVLS